MFKKKILTAVAFASLLVVGAGVGAAATINGTEVLADNTNEVPLFSTTLTTKNRTITDGFMIFDTGNGGTIRVNTNGDLSDNNVLGTLGNEGNAVHYIESYTPIGDIHSISVSYDFNLPDGWTGQHAPKIHFSYLDKDKGDIQNPVYVECDFTNNHGFLPDQVITFKSGQYPSKFRIENTEYARIKVKSIKIEYACHTHTKVDDKLISFKEDIGIVGTYNQFNLDAIGESYKFVKNTSITDKNVYECTVNLKENDAIKVVIGRSWDFYALRNDFFGTSTSEKTNPFAGNASLKYEGDNADIKCIKGGTFKFQLIWDSEYKTTSGNCLFA